MGTEPLCSTNNGPLMTGFCPGRAPLTGLQGGGPTPTPASPRQPFLGVKWIESSASGHRTSFFRP